MKNDLTVRYNQTDEHIINNPRFKEIERQKLL